MNRSAFHLALLLLLGSSGCATLRTIPGTTVSDTRQNRDILNVCERYRHALEDRDASQLLALAHPQYFEDSGTPLASDDYGYEGLKDVLSKRLSAVRTIRYNIEYRKIEVSGSRARVDIRYDASFQLATEMGDRWERKQNDKRIELESDKGRWLIIGGM
jgi:hypothetical protein